MSIQLSPQAVPVSHAAEARGERALRSPIGEIMDSKGTLSAATSPARERITAEASIMIQVGEELGWIQQKTRIKCENQMRIETERTCVSGTRQNAKLNVLATGEDER